MRQLSGHDAGFLYSDTTHSNANVSLLHIHDQSTADGGVVRFKSILAHIERRLHRAPLFRQRLLRVPLGLDRPYWVDDEEFDLEYHVRHIALPKPGDWRQFCIQVSRIHARPLDTDRPLWELYVIEGLDSFLDLPVGSFAMLLKTHLSAVDVNQLGELSALFYETTPRPTREGPPEPWFADNPPSSLGLIWRGLTRSLTVPMRLAGPLTRVATRVMPAAVELASEMLLRPENLPVTRFNSVVSPHRVFETRRFPESEFDAIRGLVDSATLDDAVIAVCGGALRRYLDAQGELPAGHSLAAILPEPASRGGDGLAWRHVPLGTDIADPVERLRAVHLQYSADPDTVTKVIGSRALADVAEQISASTLAMTRRLLDLASARVGRRAPPANCTISSVSHPAGSGTTMYLCGARLSYFSAILSIHDGLGLAFAVTRCDGKVVISPTSCRELMPDPERFAQCLRDSFQEYLALAQAAPAAAAPKKAPAKRVRSASPSASASHTESQAHPVV